MTHRAALVAALSCGSLLVVSCSRPTAGTATPEARALDWARTHVGASATVRPAEALPLPGLSCFEARVAGGAARSVCVHPIDGPLAGASGFATWLRGRHFSPARLTVEPEVALAAWDRFTDHAPYQPNRTLSRREGQRLLLQFDGLDGSTMVRRGRALAIAPDGSAVEAPDPQLPEDTVPVGEGITRVRDWWSSEARDMELWTRLRELELPGIQCFAGTRLRAQPLSLTVGACLRGTEVLAGPDGFAAYLRARGFHPEQPRLEPAKLAAAATLFTGIWNDFSLREAVSAVEPRTGDLVITVEALHRLPGSNYRLNRVLRVDRSGRITEGWIEPGSREYHVGPPPSPAAFNRMHQPDAGPGDATVPLRAAPAAAPARTASAPNRR